MPGTGYLGWALWPTGLAAEGNQAIDRQMQGRSTCPVEYAKESSVDISYQPLQPILSRLSAFAEFNVNPAAQRG